MIVGIYLAAGRSIRMGCNKLSLPFKGFSLGSTALKTALLSELDYVFVVTREQDPLDWMDISLISQTYANRWQKLECLEAIQGMSFSLRAGVLAAQKMNAEAIVVLLADQPYVTQDMINELIDQFKKNRTGFIASSHNGQIAPPVLFDSQLYSELNQLQGDEGARRIIQNHPSKGRIVEFQTSESFLDIDTMEQYQFQLMHPTD